MLDWTPLIDLLRSPSRVLLTTHVRPDGDGLGSMLALAEVLERKGREVRRVIASVLPARYQFLDPEGRIHRIPTGATAADYEADCVCILDTGTWNQLGDFGPILRSLSVPKVVIDHHQTQDDLGAVRFVDTSAEATGRLVFEAIRALGEPLPPRGANALFVALAMDTGWFHHSNTTAKTFALAAELVAAGARPEVLYERLFEDTTLPRLKLMGLVLGRLQVTHGGRVAHTEIHLNDYVASGAVPQDTEDMVNYTRSLAGVEVGLFFMEQPRGGVKVSMRSRARVDVARLAERFGGGGHQRAAGAVVQAPLEIAKARVLEAVAGALAEAT